jgi:hypothetical protein
MGYCCSPPREGRRQPRPGMERPRRVLFMKEVSTSASLGMTQQHSVAPGVRQFTPTCAKQTSIAPCRQLEYIDDAGGIACSVRKRRCKTDISLMGSGPDPGRGNRSIPCAAQRPRWSAASPRASLNTDPSWTSLPSSLHSSTPQPSHLHPSPSLCSPRALLPLPPPLQLSPLTCSCHCARATHSAPPP